MKQYLELMQYVLNNGHQKADRTGTGTLSTFGYQMRFNLQDGFPLVTTKKCHLRSIIHELLWFLNGDTNTKYLEDNGVTIWREWANENGDLGPVYGKQWREWVGPDGKHHDQISAVVEQLRNDPDNRRIIVSAWNVAELDEMALAPCHAFFQFYTRELSTDERLDWLQDNNPDQFKEPCFSHDAVYHDSVMHKELDAYSVPRRILSCQLYQRKLSCAF